MFLLCPEGTLPPGHSSFSGCHGVISQTRTYPQQIGPSLRWKLAVGALAGGFRWPHSRFTGIIHLCCCPGWDEEGSGSSRRARSWRRTISPPPCRPFYHGHSSSSSAGRWLLNVVKSSQAQGKHGGFRGPGKHLPSMAAVLLPAPWSHVSNPRGAVTLPMVGNQKTQEMVLLA